MMNYLPEGSYPQTESEVALSAEAKELFGINIGDQVVINTPAGDFAYTVSGFYEDDMEFNNIIQGRCMESTTVSFLLFLATNHPTFLWLVFSAS